MGFGNDTVTAETLTCLSPAKLNLFLHVVGRRPDGRHNLQTVFRLLDWGDDMTFELAGHGGCTLESAMPDVPPSENLILQAAQLILARAESTTGVRIRIEKRIPMGGGLGGGSSNAATTLLAINQLLNLGYSAENLAEMGLQLGADVPVFVHGQSAWAEGLGETLTGIELPERWYVLLRPSCHVSTAEIFNAPELTRNTAPITMSAFFAGGARNDLQSVVVKRHPEVHKALKILGKSTPAMMTGSGACVFAEVDSENRARAIAAEMPESMAPIVARGLNQRPPFIAHSE
ncbi:MAG: 4-(cytidine 5'-diphospho)-2-C-methyl-D-erythritol kinase [Luminiphilus sp.]|nr:4-(cytidine 5'-diphospho)-2-C-methyl-D-erythritol kinase [Luminiphilus sp.]